MKVILYWVLCCQNQFIHYETIYYILFIYLVIIFSTTSKFEYNIWNYVKRYNFRSFLLCTALKHMQYIHSKYERQSTVWQLKIMLIIISINKLSEIVIAACWQKAKVYTGGIWLRSSYSRQSFNCIPALGNFFILV